MADVIRFVFCSNLVGHVATDASFGSERERERGGTGTRGSHPAGSYVSNEFEEEAPQDKRRVIIPEPSGLELSGLPDFLPPRSVETEAWVVQREADCVLDTRRYKT